jgi:hypothetical protein
MGFDELNPKGRGPKGGTASKCDAELLPPADKQFALSPVEG